MKPVSKKTFRGTFIFFGLLVLIFLLPDIIAAFRTPSEVEITQDDEVKVAYHKLEKEGEQSYRPRKKKQFHVPPSKFDPNTYTLEDWMNLGLSEKQSVVALKFAKYGLRSNNDLRKIVVINDALYALIKDSTFYPESIAETKTFGNQKKEGINKEPLFVDLNTADQEDLQKVPGIGPFYAKYIIITREKLGGFYTKSQLLEVWKVSEDQLAQWSPYLVIDPGKIRKINLNKATDKELAAHPYISWNLANSLVKLRQQNGLYTSVEGIRRSVLVDADLYKKLTYYLKTEE